MSEALVSYDDATFRIMAEASPSMIFVSKDGKTIYANRRCSEVLGYGREELAGAGLDVLGLFAIPSRNRLQELLALSANNGEAAPFTCTLRKKTGECVDGMITVRLIRYNNEAAVLCIVSEPPRGQDLQEAEEQYRATINSLPDAIHVVDRDLNILMVNDALRKRNSELGLPVGANLRDIFPALPESSRSEYEKVFATGKISEVEEHLELHGSKLYAQVRRIPVIENGRVTRIITVIHDVSGDKDRERDLQNLNEELHKSNEKLRKLALTDVHTGLYNHHCLEEVLEREFYRAKLENLPIAVVMLDIDYFKSINDVYGHHFGDLVLKQFASNLRTIVRRDDTVIRYGGEEFVIICPHANRAAALKSAQRLLDTITVTSFGDKKNSIKLKVSIGVVSYPEDGVVKAMDLIEMVEHILDKAKERGGNRAYSADDLKLLKYLDRDKKETGADVKYLKEKIGRLNKKANQGLVEAIFAFAKTIELKDHYTGEHVEKTVQYATRIAEKIGLAKEEVLLIRQAAVLHDLGKVGISEKILQKPTKLSLKEFKIIKEHPLIGADILRPIHLLHNIVPLIMHHHERWDGKGYPLGLKGGEIPMGARIIAVADVYQALISNRPYRKALAKSRAKSIIKDGSGTQFDPRIVEVFLKII